MPLQEGRNWFESIKGTPVRDRIFVLMLFGIFLLVGTNVTTWIHFSNKEKQAFDLRLEAERKLEIVRAENVRDAKDCNEAIREAEERCEAKWEIKFEQERILNQKYLEDKANKLEQELNYLKRESRRIKDEAKAIKSRVNV